MADDVNTEWPYDPKNGYEAIKRHALTEARVHAATLRILAEKLPEFVERGYWRSVESYLHEMEDRQAHVSSAAEWLREWADEPEAWAERYTA